MNHHKVDHMILHKHWGLHLRKHLHLQLGKVDCDNGVNIIHCNIDI